MQQVYVSHGKNTFVFIVPFRSVCLSELLLGLLEFVHALDGISLVPGPPLGRLTVDLGHGSLQLSLGLLLLFKLLPQQIAVVPGRLESVSEAVLGLMKRGHQATALQTSILFKRQ